MTSESQDIKNAWGGNPADIDPDEFCRWCEHSSIPDLDGTLHYANCTRNTPEAVAWEAAQDCGCLGLSHRDSCPQWEMPL